MAIKFRFACFLLQHARTGVNSVPTNALEFADNDHVVHQRRVDVQSLHLGPSHSLKTGFGRCKRLPSSFCCAACVSSTVTFA